MNKLNPTTRVILDRNGKTLFLIHGRWYKRIDSKDYWVLDTIGIGYSIKNPVQYLGTDDFYGKENRSYHFFESIGCPPYYRGHIDPTNLEPLDWKI